MVNNVIELTKAQKLALIKKKKAALLSLNEREIRLSKEQETRDQAIKQYEIENKMMFFGHPGKGYLGRYGTWEPNPIQELLFEAFKNPKYKELCLVGANRISKTFSSTGIAAMLALRGKFPWEDETVPRWFWKIHKWKPPIKIRIIGQSWESHIKMVIVPTIRELFPESWNMQARKNNTGVEFYWTDPLSKGTIEILSDRSDTSVFEGWSGHMVIYDEPSKRDVRIACARGLMDYRGIEIFAMTLINAPWVDVEVINKCDNFGNPDLSVFSVIGKTSDNQGFGVDQESIDDFASKLTPEERKIRLEGEASHKSGLVLKFERQKHVIERFSIPPHYIVDVAIDIGVAKPHSVMYVATAGNGYKYVCFEEQVKGDGAAVGDSIINKMKRYSLRINRIIIDPLAKADQNQEYTTYDMIDRTLFRFGFMLECGAKSKEDGVILINELLNTLHGTPSLFIFRDCGMSVKQLENWMYDETGKIIKPRPKDMVQDDYCENLYRLILLNTTYFEPKDPDYDKYNDKAEQRNKYTGY